MPATFHGTTSEQDRLTIAINRHCHCPQTGDGLAPDESCSVHQFLHNQRILDGLLAFYRLRGRLLAEEFQPTKAKE